MTQIIKLDAHSWAVANPILGNGLLGIETTTNNVKFGDGTTAWNKLPYGIIPTNLGSKGVVSTGGPGDTSSALLGVYQGRSIVILTNNNDEAWAMELDPTGAVVLGNIDCGGPS